MTQLRTIFLFDHFLVLCLNPFPILPTVNKYINIFGIAQFVGLIFAPTLGAYIDSDDKLPIGATYNQYRRMKIRKCATALFITNSVSLITSVAVLVPNLETQV